MQLCRLTSASFHGSGQPLGVETRRTPANSRYDRNMSAQPMNARSWKPTLSLRPFVSEFAFRDERFDKGQKYTPLTARIDCFLQFYFKSRYRVVNVSSGAIHLAPRSVLVGPHTQRREDLLCAGHLRIFTIRFSAIGFRALFGIPARLIADYANHADSVLGASFRELEDRLASTTVEQMPVVADAFLSCQLGRRNMPPDGVARVKRSADRANIPGACRTDTKGIWSPCPVEARLGSWRNGDSAGLGRHRCCIGLFRPGAHDPGVSHFQWRHPSAV